MPKILELAELEVANTEVPQLIGYCTGSKLLSFSDDEYIFREHEEGTEIYLVIEGAFNVEQGGGDAPITTLSSHWIENSEPCFVGEMAYFGNGLRTASIRCSGITHVLELKPEHLEIILDKLPTFTQILCRQFTKRLKEANDILRDLTAADSMHVEHENFNSGDIIIEQGSKADKLHLLIFGELEWLQNGELIDAAPIIEFIEPAAYFSGKTHTRSVRAIGPTMTASTDLTDKEAVIRNYPKLILKLLSTSVPG